MLFVDNYNLVTPPPRKCPPAVDFLVLVTKGRELVTTLLGWGVGGYIDLFHEIS